MPDLLTWADHFSGRPDDDLGPVLRLLAVGGVIYDRARLVCTRRGRPGARALARAMLRYVEHVELEVLDLADPSDHAALFAALSPVVAGLPDTPTDVLLSAGTPQAQTLWVVLVQAGLLKARMLQVIPPRFVPHPHPEPVREVSLDIPGFPEIRALKDEVIRLRARVAAATGDLVGDSAPMRALAERLGRVAASDVPVLVLGETGVGKELVARAVHEASPRAGAAFVAESCGAFSEGTLSSELFGHVAGAFTGATGRRRGLFEQADGGTLFLDEVGELPPAVQVKLLRALQTGEVRPVGSEAPVAVDVRIVAATHRDLAAEVAAGRFREDLYYRLRGAELRVPPLRDRRGDLAALVLHFLAEAGRPTLRPTRAAWAAVHAYDWPGNVRALRAEVRRWAVFCDDDVVALADLSAELQAADQPAGPAAPAAPEGSSAAPEDGPGTLAEQVAAVERRAIEACLVAEGGNLSGAARALGIDRNTLKRKMKTFGLR